MKPEQFKRLAEAEDEVGQLTAGLPPEIADLLSVVRRNAARRCAEIAAKESCGWNCDCGQNHAEDAAAEIRREFDLNAPN